MARLSDGDFETFYDYHHTFLIKMKDTDNFKNLEFLGEYFNTGKRLDQSQPNVTNKALDKTHDGEQMIFHYFTNCRKALTGVSGGLLYKYNGLYLQIGFSNPLVGFRKCAVKLTEYQGSAKWAYEHLDDGYDGMTSIQGNWKATARFEDSKKPVLNITLGKRDEYMY